MVPNDASKQELPPPPEGMYLDVSHNLGHLGHNPVDKVEIQAIKSEHDTAKLLQLATFVARQPRFMSYQGDLAELIENIALRFATGLREGRHLSLMTTFDPELECENVLGYIYSKTTGEFKANEIENLRYHAELPIPPKIIYKTFIQPLIPSFQQTAEGTEKISWDLNGTPKFLFSHYERDHDIQGDTGILLLAEVDPSVRKHGLSKLLIQSALNNFHSLGVSNVFAFARCAKFSEYEPDRIKALGNLQDYIARRDEEGWHPDYGIRFHQKAGAQIICGIPNCSLDPESHNHMCLVVYTVKNE